MLDGRLGIVLALSSLLSRLVLLELVLCWLDYTCLMPLLFFVQHSLYFFLQHSGIHSAYGFVL